MIHGSYLEKEIHCLEENKSFQASLSSRPCLSEETGHTGFIGCRSSSIHWTLQWTRFNVLGTKGLLSRSQWNTSCSQYHPNTSGGLASQVPKYHHSCQPVPLRFQKQLWGWGRLRAGGEVGNRTRELDGITNSTDMSSRNSGRWWRRRKPGVPQSVGSESDITEWLKNSLSTDRPPGQEFSALVLPSFQAA